MRIAHATLAYPVLLCVVLLSLGSAHSEPRAPAMVCEATELDEIVGYTALVSTNVDGEFEGADFGKVVKLDNGMIFEFQEYNYTYSYRPDVIVFARSVTYSGRTLAVYKLLIDDEFYEATRVR